MKRGRVDVLLFRVSSSDKPHEIKSSGYAHPNPTKDFSVGELKKALEYFNELINNGKTQKADITMYMSTEEELEEQTYSSSTTNYCTIANFNKKASSFESHMTFNNIWEENRDAYTSCYPIYKKNKNSTE